MVVSLWHTTVIRPVLMGPTTHKPPFSTICLSNCRPHRDAFIRHSLTKAACLLYSVARDNLSQFGQCTWRGPAKIEVCHTTHSQTAHKDGLIGGTVISSTRTLRWSRTAGNGFWPVTERGRGLHDESGLTATAAAAVCQD